MSIESVSASNTTNPMLKLIFVGFLLLVVLFGTVSAVKFFLAKESKEQQVEDQNKNMLTSHKTLAISDAMFADEEPVKEIPAPKEERIVTIEPPPPPMMMPIQPVFEPVESLRMAAPRQDGPTLRERQDNAPLFSNSRNAARETNTSTNVAYGFDDSKPSESAEQFGNKLKAVSTPPTSAENLGDTSLKLLKGTFIECVLETKLDTTVAGMTSCIIPKNIFSANGKTLLIERGSRVIGEYTGSVQNGLNRIFVLWSQITTPNGVRIHLNSPGTDSLGAAGLGGHVDFHWWKRFGNALLFTLIQDAFDFATTKAKEDNGGVSYTTNSEDGMKQIIQEAMKQAGNIPPTLTKNQGEKIGIFVARDLDFSGVYKLTPTN